MGKNKLAIVSLVVMIVGFVPLLAIISPVLRSMSSSVFEYPNFLFVSMGFFIVGSLLSLFSLSRIKKYNLEGKRIASFSLIISLVAFILVLVFWVILLLIIPTWTLHA